MLVFTGVWVEDNVDDVDGVYVGLKRRLDDGALRSAVVFRAL